MSEPKTEKNLLEQLKMMVQEKYPDTKVIIEKPLNSYNSWWLDIRKNDIHIAIRWFDWSTELKVFPPREKRPANAIYKSFNDTQSLMQYIEDLLS